MEIKVRLFLTAAALSVFALISHASAQTAPLPRPVPRENPSTNKIPDEITHKGAENLERSPNGWKLAARPRLEKFRLEGTVVEVKAAENLLVVESAKTHKHYDIPLNEKTKFAADKGAKPAGAAKLSINDLRPDQTVEVTYTLDYTADLTPAPTVLKVRLQRAGQDAPSPGATTKSPAGARPSSVPQP